MDEWPRRASVREARLRLPADRGRAQPAGGRPKLVVAGPPGTLLLAHLRVVVLLCNSAHFAASTVDSTPSPHLRDLPFLTMAFPLVTLLVLTWRCLPGGLGPHLPVPLPDLVALPLRGAGLRPGGDVRLPLGRRRRAADKSGSLVGLPAALSSRVLHDRTSGWCGSSRPRCWPFLRGRRARGPGAGRCVGLTFVLPAAFAPSDARASGPLPLISLLTVVTNGSGGCSSCTGRPSSGPPCSTGCSTSRSFDLPRARGSAEHGNRGPSWRHTPSFLRGLRGPGLLLFQVWPYRYVLRVRLRRAC